MSISLAFSPCPNDTFIYHAWVKGLVAPELPPVPTLADVQELNQWAKEGVHDVTKISINCLGRILEDYVMLPVGSALGQGCGPKIIAREGFSLSDLRSKRIAVPGEDTTAHLLLSLLTPEPKQKTFCVYDDVLALIRAGIVDCGVIIHETRFTFHQEGFVEIADLGELWEEQTGLPIPLGGLVAKRSLGNEKIAQITDAIQSSLRFAWDNPEAGASYRQTYSLEMDPEVLQQHIDLYVNEESLQLSPEGIQAVDHLLSEGRRIGLLPHSDKDWLFEPEKVLAGAK